MDDNIGFVVNIESVFNFDIDYDFDDETRKRFSRVFGLEYSYSDQDGFNIGIAHRTRLRGVTMKKNIGYKHKKLASQALVELKNIINRCGGFIRYEIDSIDVFNRFIVNLYDPITGQCLNDILLQPKYSAIFKVYHPKNNSIKCMTSRSYS